MIANYYSLKPISSSFMVKNSHGKYDLYEMNHIYEVKGYDQLEDVYILCDVDGKNQDNRYISGNDFHLHFDRVAYTPTKGLLEESDWFQELKCELLEQSERLLGGDWIDVEKAIDIIGLALKTNLA